MRALLRACGFTLKSALRIRKAYLAYRRVGALSKRAAIAIIGAKRGQAARMADCLHTGRFDAINPQFPMVMLTNHWV